MNSLVGFGAVAAFIISAVRRFVKDIKFSPAIIWLFIFLEKHCCSLI